MRKYKATFIEVVRQTVEFPADEVTASSQDRINAAAMHVLEEQGAYEEIISVTLVNTEDVTPTEEKAQESYTRWYVEEGRVYFRSRRTDKDYEIVKAMLNNDAGSSTFIIIQVDADRISYGNVLDYFFYPEDKYIPDYEPQYNAHISDVIKEWEDHNYVPV